MSAVRLLLPVAALGCFGVGLLADVPALYTLFLCAVGVLLLLLTLFELHAKISAEQLTALALLTAMAVMGRVLFAALPNVQAATFLLVIGGITLGWQMGLAAGALTGLLSCLVMGGGTFTPWMMLGWGVVGLLSGLFAPLLRRSLVATCLFAGLMCWVYSTILDCWVLLTGLYAGTWWAVLAAGYAFQVPVVVFTVALTALTGRAMMSGLDRIATKYGLRRG